MLFLKDIVVKIPYYSFSQPNANLATLLERIKALESQSKPSTATIQKDIIQYALRHINDFDKYVALEKVERLKHLAAEEKDKKADFFGSVHSTLLDRIEKPKEQF